MWHTLVCVTLRVSHGHQPHLYSKRHSYHEKVTEKKDGKKYNVRELVLVLAVNVI